VERPPLVRVVVFDGVLWPGSVATRALQRQEPKGRHSQKAHGRTEGRQGGAARASVGGEGGSPLKSPATHPPPVEMLRRHSSDGANFDFG
jgi:hypothetical protein